MAGTGLVIPGQTTTALVLNAGSASTAGQGRTKLDSRLLSLLSANDVPPEQLDKIGNANVKTTAIFGQITKDEKRFAAWCKKILNLDADTNPEDMIPIAQLTIVGQACLKRAEVETEAAAQRAVNHLPPQLSILDHAAARDAYEKVVRKKIPDHKLPSENYFEIKCGEIDQGWQAERLSEVTNLAQERAQQKPRESQALSMEFDNLKRQKKDFYVPMPSDESELRNRFDVMGARLEMMKLKFPNNPVLDSATLAAKRSTSTTFVASASGHSSPSTRTAVRSLAPPSRSSWATTTP